MTVRRRMQGVDRDRLRTAARAGPIEHRPQIDDARHGVVRDGRGDRRGNRLGETLAGEGRAVTGEVRREHDPRVRHAPRQPRDDATKAPLEAALLVGNLPSGGGEPVREGVDGARGRERPEQAKRDRRRQVAVPKRQHVVRADGQGDEVGRGVGERPQPRRRGTVRPQVIGPEPGAGGERPKRERDASPCQLAAEERGIRGRGVIEPPERNARDPEAAAAAPAGTRRTRPKAPGNRVTDRHVTHRRQHRVTDPSAAGAGARRAPIIAVRRRRR